LLLVPGAKAPVAVSARGKQVCSCFDVSVSQIGAVLSAYSGNADAQLAKVQDQLKCGSNCGSCIPELKRLVRARQAAA
jgi:assimilatory nitrate reductase catalytic subunit